MSISFFTLIAGSTGKLEKYVGCQTKMKGIFKYWDEIDNYLQLIDKNFCSKNYACIINKYTDQIFKNDPIIKPIYSELYKNGEIEVRDIGDVSDDGYISWRKYPKSQQASIVKTATLTMKGLDVDDFSPRIFNRFWEHIENKFDCTGFCSTVYQLTPQDLNDYHSIAIADTKTYPLQIPMFKYLFSDINRGIPKHIGCMRPLMKWLPKMLISFGSFALFTGLVQLMLFFLSIQLISNPTEGGANEKPPSSSQVYQKEENKNLTEEEKKE